MSRRLARSVLSGGVVYPAGTAEDAIKNPGKIADRFWDTEGETTASDAPEVYPTHPVTVRLRELVEYLAEVHVQDVDVPLAELLAQAVEVFGDPAPATAPADPDADPDADPAPTTVATPDAGVEASRGGAYADLDIEALKAEIDKRNEDRDQDDRISKRGGIETLVAALVADDQHQA